MLQKDRLHALGLAGWLAGRARLAGALGNGECNNITGVATRRTVVSANQRPSQSGDFFQELSRLFTVAQLALSRAALQVLMVTCSSAAAVLASPNAAAIFASHSITRLVSGEAEDEDKGHEIRVRQRPWSPATIGLVRSGSQLRRLQALTRIFSLYESLWLSYPLSLPTTHSAFSCRPLLQAVLLALKCDCENLLTTKVCAPPSRLHHLHLESESFFHEPRRDCAGACLPDKAA